MERLSAESKPKVSSFARDFLRLASSQPYSSLAKSHLPFLASQLRKAGKQPSQINAGEGWGEYMSVFDEMNVIASYRLEQAVEDGVLVEIFKNGWRELSDGMPIVATAHIFDEISLAGLMEIWNEFVVWRKDVSPTLPDEERLFSTSMNRREVWVVEDGAAFTCMYPEDY